MDSARASCLTVGETVREEGFSPVNRWFYDDRKIFYDVTTLAGAQRPGRRAPGCIGFRAHRSNSTK
jgi:hypothetical protein